MYLNIDEDLEEVEEQGEQAEKGGDLMKKYLLRKVLRMMRHRQLYEFSFEQLWHYLYENIKLSRSFRYIDIKVYTVYHINILAYE